MKKVNSTKKLISIIDFLLSEEHPCGVSEIGRRLGMSKANAHNILTSLKEEGWIEQDPNTEQYFLGGRLVEIGLRLLSNHPLEKISLPYLNMLRQETGETSALVMRLDLERIYVQQVPSRHELRSIPEIGRRIPLWLGSPSKVIFAFLEENEREEVFNKLNSSGLNVYVSGKPISIYSIREELAKIRNQGYAISVAERVSDTCALSAPIFDHNNMVIGSLCVAGPLPRFGPELAEKYSALVKSAAQDISLKLGARLMEALPSYSGKIG